MNLFILVFEFIYFSFQRTVQIVFLAESSIIPEQLERRSNTLTSEGHVYYKSYKE